MCTALQPDIRTALSGIISDLEVRIDEDASWLALADALSDAYASADLTYARLAGLPRNQWARAVLARDACLLLARTDQEKWAIGEVAFSAHYWNGDTGALAVGAWRMPAFRTLLRLGAVLLSLGFALLGADRCKVCPDCQRVRSLQAYLAGIPCPWCADH